MIPFAIQIIPASLLFMGSLWIRDSPRWLFLHDHRKEAMQNLCWIRQLTPTDIYITEEVAAIDAAHEAQKAVVGVGLWKPFQALGQRPSMMYRLFLGCMLFFWQNGSGINAINYYSPTIFAVRIFPLLRACSLLDRSRQLILLSAEHWRPGRYRQYHDWHFRCC